MIEREVAEVVAHPPVTSDNEPTWLTRMARRALVIRRTPMGRLLYRMTPAPLIDALKARLDA